MFPKPSRVRISRPLLAIQTAIISICFVPELQGTELFSSLRERTDSFLGHLLGQDRATEPEACCVEEPASHTLVGTYVIRENLAANLFLNNKLDEPLEVHPALVSRYGQEMQLPPVMVPANSFEFFNVAVWAALGGEAFTSGTIKLTYASDMDLVLGAQINFADETNSLSFEERLVEIGRFNSRRQEAIWWMPSDETTVEVFLANTTNEPISVSAVLAAKPSIDEAVQNIELLPYETKVLNLRTEFVQGPQVVNANLIALSVRHSSTSNDALLARVWVGEEQRGYSTIVRFSNPDSAKMSEYHGAGFQIEDIGNIRFKPVIAARNVGTEEAKVRVRVPYTRSNGTPASISLPVETIKPGKMVRFDPAKILDRVDSHNIAVAGLEITYDTAPGTIIASAQSVSTDRNHVFRVLLNDPLALPNASGGYPWRVEGTSTTQVYIKNAVDYEQDYVAHIVWEGEGIYTIGSNAIAAHETVNIDIKKLRDEQTPDNMGRTIPQTVTRGQIFWSLRRKDTQPAEDALAMRSLVGRSQQEDIAKGIVTDYVCVNCCPNSYQSAFILTSPPGGSTTIGVSQNLTLQAFEQQSACPSGSNVVTVGAYWYSTDTNVATVSGGTVTGVGPGTASINAEWTARTYTKIFTSCQQVAQFQVTATKTVNVAPNISKIQYKGPNNENFTDVSGTLYVLKDTEVAFKAIPVSSSFPSGSPIWSGTSGAIGSGETKAVTFSTVSSNTSDFKTVVASTGNSSTVNVVVYELTGTLSPQDSFAGRSTSSYGLLEKVDLDISVSPSVTANQAGGFRWSVGTNQGTVTNATGNTGVAEYEAPFDAMSVTLDVSLVDGPSKGVKRSYSKSVVAPTGGSVTRNAGLPLIHCNGLSSAGFYGIIYLSPTNVSFARIYFKEGVGTIEASGFYEPEDDLEHPAWSAAFLPSQCSLATGCAAYEADVIYTGRWTGPFSPGVSTVQIEWQYAQNEAGASPVTFATAEHDQSADNVGTATISKQGSGNFSRSVNDSTSGDGCTLGNYY